MYEYYVVYLTKDKQKFEEYGGGYLNEKEVGKVLEEILKRDDVFHAWVERDYIMP